VAELARAIRDLERLVESAEPAPVTRAAGTDGPTAAESAGFTEPAEPADGAAEPAGGTDEAGFALFAEEANLTRREAEVLRHLLDGHSNRRISRSLRISESTVKNHLHAIFVKLDTTDRTQLIAKVYRFMAEHTARPVPTPRAARGGRAQEGGEPAR
jgi:DNA-binding NarL/FixJ family response regulator